MPVVSAPLHILGGGFDFGLINITPKLKVCDQ